MGGSVTYSLALGPFHPAWRGPQRFDLKVAGEHIADVEYHDGFNERGCAERLPRLDLPQALHLVTRVCGTCSFAHSLAFCQAIEQLCGMNVSERAQMLRCVAAAESASSHGSSGLTCSAAWTMGESLQAPRSSGASCGACGWISGLPK